MGVRRFTIELDDAPDIGRETSLPSSLAPERVARVDRLEPTSTPSEQPDYPRGASSSEGAIRSGSSEEKVGRTFSDLVLISTKRAEIMATCLTALALFLSAGSIKKASDIWISLIFALLLNAVWFGALVIRKFFGGREDR